MDDKIGMSLDEIHKSGNVPQCECFYGDIFGLFTRYLSQR